MNSEDVPSPVPKADVELAPVQEPTRTLKRVPIRTSALESFKDCIEHGAACLSSVNLPDASRKALEGSNSRQPSRRAAKRWTWPWTVLIRTAHSSPRRYPKSAPVKRPCPSWTPRDHQQPRMRCLCSSRGGGSAKGEENFTYPASFAHLCAFCCVCAALEDAADDELAQTKRKSDRSAFEAERAYRDLVRAPPQTKDECLDWIDELHACGALSEGTCGSMAEAIPQRKTNVATVVRRPVFEADVDACATYEALHESG